MVFWAAYLVPDLFNCKHKPFISTVLINGNRPLTYAGMTRISSRDKNFKNAFTEINMAHIIISLKRAWDGVCNLENLIFASVVAQDHVLSV